MGSLNPLKLAIFALLIISGIVSVFGARPKMVIEEVLTMRKADEQCSQENEICFPQKGVECCQNLVCLQPAILPPPCFPWEPCPPPPPLLPGTCYSV